MATLVEIPVTKYFSAERVREIEGYVKDRLQSRIRGLSGIRDKKISQWRKIYAGTPREKTKSFPWQNACLTLDTEILTKGGWKAIGDVKIGDYVLSRDASGNADFYLVKKTFRYLAEELIHFQGKSIDLLVTPNHNMLLEDKLGRTFFKQAEDFVNEPVTYRYIPLTSKKRSCVIDEDRDAIPYFRFLGWYLSEGCTYKSGTISIAQSRKANPEKYAVLIEDIKATGWKYREVDNGIFVMARSVPPNIREELIKCGKMENKRIPRWVFEYSEDFLRELLDTLLLGDGGQNGRGDHKGFFTTSKGLADDVQELCQYIGLRGTVSKYNEQGDGGLINGRKISAKLQLYSVSINTKTRIQVAKLKRQKIVRQQEVACVEVEPHHTIYVRRNGKACWVGNSNVVIKLVRSFSDQLVAKIVMGTIAMDPIFVADLVGEFSREERAEEQRMAIEEWMALSALEPSRLNLIPKYSIWIRNMVKYGFGAIKCIPKREIEQVVREGPEGKVSFASFERYDGPVVMPIMFEDFLMASTTVELHRDPLIAQRAVLERFQLEPMKYDRSFDRLRVEEALKNPTRQGPSRQRQEIENESEARTDSAEINAQWDVYECYFPYTVNRKTFQLISTCVSDEQGQNCIFLKTVFQWLPENTLPYVGAWLAPDGERSYSPGFCELLADYQEEVSAIHNRRGDASTAANTNIFRVASGMQLDSEFSIFPMATITADQGGFEVVPLGRTASETIKDEQMTLQEAQDLVGIGPSSSGQGAGTVNKKGAYSAMGTFAVMQEGNTRPNLNVTEFRVSHYTFGRLCLMYYSHFGVTERDRNALGKMGQYLQRALENIKAGRIALPIRAATGSVNKEIEKQNLMLLLNNTRAHWQMVNQLLQGAANPMAPPEMQDYLLQVIMASNLLMKKITREFGIPDPTAILPEPLGIQDKADNIKQGLDRQKLMQQLQQQLGTGQPQPTNGGFPQPQAPGAPGMGTDQNMLPQ